MMKLKTYPHQVTGHASLLTTEDNSTIGKPVSRNELIFYKSMDPGLLPFVPEFKGVGYVTMETNSHGSECFSVVSSEFDLHRLGGKISKTQRPTDEIFYRGLDQNEYANQRDDGFAPNEYVIDKRKLLPTLSMGHTPWAGQLKNIGRERFKANEKPIHFLFLDNISKHFTHPCILDLKLGTRVHADRCPKQKREKHIRKSIITTTSKVGLRLTGLQVFHDGQFTCKDKLYGRGLSVEGLAQETEYFFTTDDGLRLDIIKLAMEKLTRLKTALEKLEGYRFYGSSLLIVHDGGTKNPAVSNNTTEDSSVAIKLVDFCHSTHENMTDHELKHIGPDHGALLGITNLTEMMSKIYSKYV